MACLLLNHLEVDEDINRWEHDRLKARPLTSGDFQGAAVVLRLSGKEAICLPGKFKLGTQSFYYAVWLMQMDPGGNPLFVGMVERVYYSGIDTPKLELFTRNEVKERNLELYNRWKSIPKPVPAGLMATLPKESLITDLNLV